MKNNIPYQFLILSLLAHGLLLFYCLVYFKDKHSDTTLPKQVMTYLKEKPSDFLPPSHINKAEKKEPKTPQTKHRSSLRQHTTAQQVKDEHDSIKEKNAEKILQLLHEIIAKHQIYPDTAVELDQSGVVTLGFILYPDGHIEAVSILQSSGYENLDRAAIGALKASTPIEGMKEYLPKAHFFTIAIEFKMS